MRKFIGVLYVFISINGIALSCEKCEEIKISIEKKLDQKRIDYLFSIDPLADMERSQKIYQQILAHQEDLQIIENIIK